MEAAIAAVRDRLGATGALVHPLGILSIAAWIGTHDAVSSRLLDELRFDTAGRAGGPDRDRRARAGHRRIPPESHRGRRRPAASPSSPAGRPAPSPATRASALAAMATGDLDQARTFVHRELHGLAADDDLTARLAATLRTYLDEHVQPQPHRQAARHPREHRQLPDQAGGGDPRAQRRSAHARAPRRARACAPRPRARRLTAARAGAFVAVAQSGPVGSSGSDERRLAPRP